MKRNARRAVLFACFVLGAGWLEAQPAAAGDVCAQAGVNSSPSGPCVPTGVGTTQCVRNDFTAVVVVTTNVCVPVPL